MGDEYYRFDKKKVKSGEKSPLLQRRSSLQEKGGAAEEIIEEEPLRRQAGETSSEKVDCSEKSSTLPQDTVVEVTQK